MRSVSSALDDRTATARIRDAALARFAQDGFASTTVRAIAADAGVSPGLVMHHFGSKDGLRRACEDHLITVVEQKFVALDAGGERLNAWTALVDERLPLLPFLARVLAEGGESATELMARLVDSVRRTLERWQAAGRVRPCDDPQARAAVMVCWDLSLVLLSDQIRATTGIDPYSGAGLARLSLAALDLYTHGVLVEGEWMDQIRGAMHSMRSEPARDST